MARPLIAVTRPVSGDRLPFAAVAAGVWLAGGRAVRITERDAKLGEHFHGLVVSGGTDIYPELYNQPPKPHYRYDYGRDDLERQWLSRAEEEGLPVLGICRGAQLINVVRGGTLHMDVSKAYEKARYPSGTLARIFYRKRAHIERGSKLHSIVGLESVRINSLHTQAIDRLGSHLVGTAREANGVIQCIEDPRLPFFMGVQFHPEYLVYSKYYRRLFRALLAAARAVTG